jgi:hypothetical protein
MDNNSLSVLFSANQRNCEIQNEDAYETATVISGGTDCFMGSTNIGFVDQSDMKYKI